MRRWLVWAALPAAGCLTEFPRVAGPGAPPEIGDAARDAVEASDALLVADSGPASDGPAVEPDGAGPPPRDQGVPGTDGAPADAGPVDDGGSDGGARTDGGACAPHAETCNGLDDDCDGVVDEAPADCGPYVARQCRLSFGWAAPGAGPAGPSDRWGACPGADEPEPAGGDGVFCVSTRGDGAFRQLRFESAPNLLSAEHRFAVALRCADPAHPDLADWIERQCAVYLGVGPAEGPELTPGFGPCPGRPEGQDGAVRCTSSGFDGRFRPMPLGLPLNQGAALAVAFRCTDGHDVVRAAAMTAAAEVQLGFGARAATPPAPDGSQTWGTCPDASDNHDPAVRCVRTEGDGWFHQLRFPGQVGKLKVLALALKARARLAQE